MSFCASTSSGSTTGSVEWLHFAGKFTAGVRVADWHTSNESATCSAICSHRVVEQRVLVGPDFRRRLNASVAHRVFEQPCTSRRIADIDKDATFHLVQRRFGGSETWFGDGLFAGCFRFDIAPSKRLEKPERFT